MLRFTGVMSESYKDQICVALFGEPKPSWLRVSFVRTNSNGHTIRMHGQVNGVEAERIAGNLASNDGTAIPYAGGEVWLTQYSALR